MRIGAVVTVIATAGIVFISQAPSFGGEDDPAFSHQILERDRQIAQVMANPVGDPMSEEMAVIIGRSENEAYLRALEEHTRLYEQSLGRTPWLPLG